MSGTEMVLADRPTRLEFSSEQRALVRNAFANGATEQEFSVLMEIASSRRLNPFMKQIHFVKRWDSQAKRDVWSCQVSIDGLRAIAERTGNYDGQDEPEFTYNEKNEIISAKVRVYRKDWKRPSVGIAYWEEFVQTTREGTPTRFWKTMPHVMLAKCAEAQALRKAFPEDMSGLYTSDEMQQATPQLEEVAPQPPQLEQQLQASIDLNERRAQAASDLRDVFNVVDSEARLAGAKELMQKAIADKLLTMTAINELIAIGTAKKAELEESAARRRAASEMRELDQRVDNAIA